MSDDKKPLRTRLKVRSAKKKKASPDVKQKPAEVKDDGTNK